LAVAQLYPDRLELRVEMNSESAWLAMGEPANSVPDLAGSMPRLKEYAAEAYQLSVGGQVLVPRKTTVEYREAEGGVVLWAFFARPAAGLLRFHATYLARLPSDHRASLIMQDDAKNLVGREILTVAKTFVDLSVPPAVLSAATKLSPISSPRTTPAFVRYGVPAMLVLALLLGGYWLLRRTYRT
jgi:hypothetical protein